MKIYWVANPEEDLDVSQLKIRLRANWPLIDIEIKVKNAGVNLVAYADLTEQENNTLSMEDRQRIADNLLELCRIRWAK